MFGSNVAPKKIKFDKQDDWYCNKCDAEVKHYYGKCPACGGRRGQDDPHRKGGS